MQQQYTAKFTAKAENPCVNVRIFAFRFKIHRRALSIAVLFAIINSVNIIHSDLFLKVLMKMYNFFATEQKRNADRFCIDGADFNHIKNVLRMAVGEKLLVSCSGVTSLCKIEEFKPDYAVVQIITENYQNTELPIDIYLFQGLPKGDKAELIIQKTVELGVCKIIPVEMNRCVVKLDEKKKKAKTTRWQAIAESAAKQSKRTTIPEVSEPVPFKTALEKAKSLDLLLIPYENKSGMKSTVNALKKIKSGMSVGIMIGPEGGFEESEIELASEIGETVSLGKRILRTETAAITAVGLIMLYTEMNGENE